VAAAAVMRASHRATRVTAAPAAALMSLPCEIRDNRQHSSSECLSHWRGVVLPAFCTAVLGLTRSSSTATWWSLL